MSILNFLITKRNILTSGLSILLLLFHYNGIHNLIRSIEVEKEKRNVLISNLIKNNIDYNLSILRDFITKFETAPALVNKELVAGSIAKDLFQDSESHFNLNHYFEKMPSSEVQNMILQDQNNRYFLLSGNPIHVTFSSSLSPHSEATAQLKVTTVSLLSLNLYQLDSHKNRYFHLIKVPIPVLNGNVLIFDDMTSSAIELKNELQSLVEILLLLLASYILLATFAQYQHNTNIKLTSDTLTGLKNRTYLQSANVRLKHEHLKHTCISVIVIDLDHFKDINDQYGHPAGDEILIRVAQILSENVRCNDECYRIGGDEFIVIVKSHALSDTKKLAERLRERIAKDEKLRIMSMGGISASLGLAVLLPNQPVEEVVSMADEMLYQAKKQGRNLVQSYI
ncbi:GGDEF domain-containing protein [Vibrio coralliirubri]|uniref:GGDEF domain-containing protein n=1 Tax=Vibrio coralliirubri TaxID=1516159 RepID=UPI000636A0FC|nr:GGDEF domain-containing protein [Vibrio coralliirubri]CDT12523.1 putative Diguanylate cyclase [Vibrio coralliirubri]CDU11947.1 putative Diguanylate cyclase [Vibrio coralliirubri]